MTRSLTLIDESSLGMTWSGLLPFSWESWPGLWRGLCGATSRKIYVARIEFVVPLGPEKSTFQATNVNHPNLESDFVPRTALGRKLLGIRKRAIAAGVHLLSEDEVLEEVRRRRGEIEGDDKNLY